MSDILERLNEKIEGKKPEEKPAETKKPLTEEKGKRKSVKEILKSIEELKKVNSVGYWKLTDGWRDIIPHTGKSDIFIGPKFEKWLGEQVKDKEGDNVETLVADIDKYSKKVVEEAVEGTPGFSVALNPREKDLVWDALYNRKLASHGETDAKKVREYSELLKRFE